MKNSNEKEYNAPVFIFLFIDFKDDVLKDSTPGGGGWGYFDEDPTQTHDPTDPTDDFDW